MSHFRLAWVTLSRATERRECSIVSGGWVFEANGGFELMAIRIIRLRMVQRVQL